MTGRKIIESSDGLELFTITPIYQSRTKTINIDGVMTKVEKRVLKKELHTKKWIRKESITSVENYITHKNIISNNRSIIFDKFSNKYFAVAHNTDNMIDVMNGSKQNVSTIGFIQRNNNDLKIYRKGA